MKYKKDLTKLFLHLREIMIKVDDSVIENINSVKMYVNREGTYFTAKIDKLEYTFHFGKNLIKDMEIPEREELLIVDAFENLYEILYKRVNAEEIRYESVIDRLFQDFLKRRKQTPIKKYLELSKLQPKKYI
jgi:hydrogenase maturation factor HypF (carbamoyltransferase family)